MHLICHADHLLGSPATIESQMSSSVLNNSVCFVLAKVFFPNRPLKDGRTFQNHISPFPVVTSVLNANFRLSKL